MSDESAVKDPSERERVEAELVERREVALAQVVKFGDPVLKSRASPVGEFGPRLRAEVERMTAIMRDAMGVGLAATQLGVLRRVLRADHARGVEIAINEYAPDTGSAAAPVHHAGHEYGVVLEGKLTVEVDGTRHVLHPGDVISYESSRDHRIWNYGADRARALWVNLERG